MTAVADQDGFTGTEAAIQLARFFPLSFIRCVVTTSGVIKSATMFSTILATCMSTRVFRNADWLYSPMNPPLVCAEKKKMRGERNCRCSLIADALRSMTATEDVECKGNGTAIGIEVCQILPKLPCSATTQIRKIPPSNLAFSDPVTMAPPHKYE